MLDLDVCVRVSLSIVGPKSATGTGSALLLSSSSFPFILFGFFRLRSQLHSIPCAYRDWNAIHLFVRHFSVQSTFSNNIQLLCLCGAVQWCHIEACTPISIVSEHTVAGVCIQFRVNHRYNRSTFAALSCFTFDLVFRHGRSKSGAQSVTQWLRFRTILHRAFSCVCPPACKRISLSPINDDCQLNDSLMDVGHWLVWSTLNGIVIIRCPRRMLFFISVVSLFCCHFGNRWFLSRDTRVRVVTLPEKLFAVCWIYRAGDILSNTVYWRK